MRSIILYEQQQLSLRVRAGLWNFGYKRVFQQLLCRKSQQVGTSMSYVDNRVLPLRSTVSVYSSTKAILTVSFEQCVYC